MITLTNDDTLKLLMDRVKVWKDDPEVIDLFEKMYEKQLDDGCFEETTRTIEEIVDNDYINYCSVFSLDEIEPEYKDVFLNGVGDISCETDGRYGFIEAINDEENPTLFLVRC